MKRLVVSDVHIGSKYYKAEAFTELLQTIEYDQLILNGDIIDLIKAPVFTKRALKLFKSIDSSKEIIYIIGNHDRAFSGFVGESLMGVKFVERYEFTENQRTFRIEHGDSYDKDWIRYGFWIKFVSILQDALEHYFNVDLTSWLLNRKIKKRKLKRIWELLDLNTDVDVLITGHTHIPEAVIWVNENEQIKTYVNCGDWISHSTYVIIDDGTVRLKTFKK